MMNNLNRKASSTGGQLPDILRNVNIKDENEERHQENISHNTTVKKSLNTDVQCVQNDLNNKEKQRRKHRKIKKALGYTGWLFCFPMMLVALAIRDRPSGQDFDEWKDDPCLPWWYDVGFKYDDDENDKTD